MKNASYLLAKIKYRICGSNDEVMNNYFRKNGLSIGKNCHIYSNIVTPESYLIFIDDNTTISNEVTLITHDNSVCKPLPMYTDYFGKIRIGKNCFIGSHAIILPGVVLCDDVIVAAGSVVTKSFHEPRIIIGGNPARIIGRWDSYIQKYKGKAINVSSFSFKQKKEAILNTDKLVSKNNNNG